MTDSGPWRLIVAGDFETYQQHVIPGRGDLPRSPISSCFYGHQARAVPGQNVEALQIIPVPSGTEN